MVQRRGPKASNRQTKQNLKPLSESGYGSASNVLTLGLDLSLCRPGLVVYNGKRAVRKLVLTTSANNNDKLPARITASGNFIGNEEERIEYIAKKVRGIYMRYRPILVAIEGPAFAFKERGQVTRYELQGVIKNWFYRKEVAFYMPPPTTLKLWLAGNGKASKDEMIAAACRNGCQTDDEDIADAFAAALHAWDQGLGMLEPA